MTLRTLFITAFVIYILLILWIGHRSRQRITHSSDYSVAGRKMGSALGTMTFTATYVSALTVIGLVGGASAAGLALVPYIFIGLALGLLALVLVARRFHRAGRTAESLPELLGQRYNSPAVRVGSAAVIVIAYFVYLIAQLFAIGILLGSTMGFPNYAVVLVVGSVFVLYTLMGGLQAVARTDAAQLAMLIAGLLLTLGIVVWRISTNDAVSWSDGPGLGGLLGGPAPTWIIAIGWTLSWSLGVACQPNYLQRVLACPDTRTARNMLGFGSAMIFFLANVPVLLIGIGIAVLNPGVVGDDALPTFLMSQTGGVVAALALLGLISAVMSTTDSLLHVIGVYSARDILCPLLGVKDGQRELRLSRAATAVLGVLGVAAATWMTFSPLPLLLEFASYAVALLAAGLFVPLYVGLLWRRTTKAGALAAMGAGLVVGAVAEWMRAQGSMEIHGMVPALAAALIAVVVGTLLTRKHTNPEVPGPVVEMSETGERRAHA